MTRPAPSDPLRRAVPWRWAMVGALAGLLLALVLFTPARWLAAAVTRASEGRVVLDTARGTVWNGSARLVLAGGPGSRDAAALPSRVQWQLRPAAIGLHLSVSTACCTPQALVLRLQPRWGGGAVTVADTGPSQWPASVLQGLGLPWNTLQLEGRLQALTQGLAVEWSGARVRIHGRVELQAQGISSRLSTLRPLGSYRLTLEGGEPPLLRVTTLEGGLQLEGTGQWSGSGLRFSGQAQAAPPHEAALANLLNIIGRREGARSIITLD